MLISIGCPRRCTGVGDCCEGVARQVLVRKITKVQQLFPASQGSVYADDQGSREDPAYDGPLSSDGNVSPPLLEPCLCSTLLSVLIMFLVISGGRWYGSILIL